jgi:hypothetical protein
MFIDEEWLRVFEKSMVGKIPEPERDEVTGQGRRLNDEEAQYVYY